MQIVYVVLLTNTLPYFLSHVHYKLEALEPWKVRHKNPTMTNTNIEPDEAYPHN